MRKLIYVLIFLLSSVTTVFALIPMDNFFVNDYVGVLSQEQISDMSGRAATLQSQNGVQVVTVIVEHYIGGSLESYANRIFNEFGIGQSGDNNGLMLIVATESGGVRIEVGAGMEQYLSDAGAGHILDTYFMPMVSESGLSQAIHSTFLQLLDVGRRADTSGVVATPPTAQPQQSDAVQQPTAMRGIDFASVIFFIIVLIIVFRMTLYTSGPRRRSWNPWHRPMMPRRRGFMPPPPPPRRTTRGNTFGGGHSMGGGASRNFPSGGIGGSSSFGGGAIGGGGSSKGGGASREFSGSPSNKGSYKSPSKSYGGGGSSKGGGASRSFKK